MSDQRKFRETETEDPQVTALFGPARLGSGARLALSRHLTFRNIVIFLATATFLIFLGSVVSARIAFLFAALLALAGLVLFEMAARRRWEDEVADQLQRMNVDYDRIVREVARNRNDVAALKKNLADAGDMARSFGRGGAVSSDMPIEQRMIKAIAEQLSRIDGPVHAAGDDNRFGSGEGAGKPAVAAEQAIGDRGEGLSDEQVLLLVQNAIRQDRIDLFLQPIVNLPQRKVRFYEMFSRIRVRDEVYLPAERYIAVALEQGLLHVIDNLLLLRALQFIRDTDDVSSAFFCNITTLTLNDPKFMGDLVEFIAQNRDLAPRLVFEFGQRDLATMSADTLPVLDGLSRLGCRFSMDQVRAPSFDFAHLQARHVRFVKVDAALILGGMKEIGGLQRMKRLKAEMDRHGVDLIVEKVETEGQIRELLDIEIDYGQGYLFGKPLRDDAALTEET